MGFSREDMQSELASAASAGLRVLDLDAEVCFQEYTRVVLPLDGYIFWSPTIKRVVKGSLHFKQMIDQGEDETLGRAMVIFTAEAPVTIFEDSPIDKIYIASVGKFRYGFTQQAGLYNPQKPVWHYVGSSIEPALASQLLDTPGLIDVKQPVVSNSLPLWLALNNYVCPYYDGFSNSIPLYPSFLTPPNLVPSYGAVHIGENDTTALAAAPMLDANRSHYQLCSDKVRITLYGLQNDAAMDFVDCVNRYTLDQGTFGIMNMPVIRDGKRKQSEVLGLAMKKVIEYQISYSQARVAEVTRQLIKSAIPTYIFN